MEKVFKLRRPVWNGKDYEWQPNGEIVIEVEAEERKEEMNLEEMKKEQERLEEQLEKVKQDIASFDTTLHLRNADARFIDWHLDELTELYNIDTNAYMWFQEKRERANCTIKDYNEANPKRKIVFASRR